ncbi:MAG: hypothetical protein M3305_14435 [Actinomycetota bacterium]|nr:hypothetical protein [Actinomycetota bacterium]
MRRLMMLLAVMLVMTAMVMFAGPVSAQGGCQAFGHSVAEDAKEFQPLGQNFVSGAAPLNDEALAEQELFCG